MARWASSAFSYSSSRCRALPFAAAMRFGPGIIGPEQALCIATCAVARTSARATGRALGGVNTGHLVASLGSRRRGGQLFLANWFERDARQRLRTREDSRPMLVAGTFAPPHAPSDRGLRAARPRRDALEPRTSPGWWRATHSGKVIDDQKQPREVALTASDEFVRDMVIGMSDGLKVCPSPWRRAYRETQTPTFVIRHGRTGADRPQGREQWASAVSSPPPRRQSTPHEYRPEKEDEVKNLPTSNDREVAGPPYGGASVSRITTSRRSQGVRGETPRPGSIS